MQKKTKIELVITVAMSIALVFAILSLMKRPRQGRGPVVPKGTPVAAKPIARPERSTLGIKVKRIKDDNFFVRLSRVADALPLERDPFSFEETGPKSLRDSLTLSGIFGGGEGGTAVIEGAFYKEGDSTDSFTVVKIEANKVILKDKDGEFELFLKS